MLFDNSAAELSIVATQEQGELRILQAKRYNDLIARYGKL